MEGFKEVVKKIITVSIALITIIIATIIIANFFEEPLEHVMTDGYGQPMIDFELSDLDANLYSVTGDSGKPKLLNFWTSWCVYCKEEAKHLNKIFSEFKEDIEIVSINVTTSDNEGDAMDFISEYNIEFPVLFDYEGIVSSQYRITAIPTNYFIDRDGTIKAITHEITKSNSRDLIEELLHK